jgi:hypothetical protein
MVEKMLDYLATATYSPPPGYKIDRDTRFHFYERYLSPDFKGLAEFDQGCGALNLVNVAEPLKVARMVAGIDDTSDEKLVVHPRLPDSWSGFAAKNWPVNVRGQNYAADIEVEKRNDGVRFTLKVHGEAAIPEVELVWGNGGPDERKTFGNVSTVSYSL